MSIATTYLVFRPGMEPSTGTMLLPHKPSYHELRVAVEPFLEGGRMEHVAVLYQNQHADMFVDEIGIQKGLARNDRATDIYRAAAMRRDPRLAPEQLACIYGPAVLFTNRLVWF